MAFSKPDTIGSLQITPLGAAIVEALPDRKKANRINRAFKQKKQCPVSCLFNTAQVIAFYQQRGESVTAVYKS